MLERLCFLRYQWHQQLMSAASKAAEGKHGQLGAPASMGRPRTSARRLASAGILYFFFSCTCAGKKERRKTKGGVASDSLESANQTAARQPAEIWARTSRMNSFAVAAGAWLATGSREGHVLPLHQNVASTQWHELTLLSNELSPFCFTTLLSINIHVR